MKEKIKTLFAMLTRADQLELLRELTSDTEIENPVTKLNELCQIQYRQNIAFQVTNTGTDGAPQILVKLTTPWGEFEYMAINQKIAKARTAEMALETLYNQMNEH
jgi:dsRNA-specific ribonuclease